MAQGVGDVLLLLLLLPPPPPPPPPPREPRVVLRPGVGLRRAPAAAGRAVRAEEVYGRRGPCFVALRRITSDGARDAPEPALPDHLRGWAFRPALLRAVHRARDRVATWVAGRELNRKGYDTALALDALFFVVPLGFVGARLYHVVTDYELYANDPFPGVFEVWNGGLGIYGAVLGGFVGLLIFARVRRINPLILADASAPGLALAQAVGRWGNYFNQELFGRPSNLPWAIEIV